MIDWGWNFISIYKSKPSVFLWRPRKRDVVLSSEIANTDYPEEPDDEDVIRIKQEEKQQQQTDDGVDSDTSSIGEENDSFRILYNAVKTYKLGAQNLIDPFMKLPNKRFHQDYYEEIQQPIAMSVIKNQIKVNDEYFKNMNFCFLSRKDDIFN
jgi:hypothetical protein